MPACATSAPRVAARATVVVAWSAITLALAAITACQDAGRMPSDAGSVRASPDGGEPTQGDTLLPIESAPIAASDDDDADRSGITRTDGTQMPLNGVLPIGLRDALLLWMGYTPPLDCDPLQ